MHPPKKIVVGLNATRAGEEALRQAFSLAAADPDVELHVVRVLEPRGLVALPDGDETSEMAPSVRACAETQRSVAMVMQGLDMEPHRDVHVHVRHGRLAQQVTELAHSLDAEQIIVGLQDHSGSEHPARQRSAEDVLGDAGCPVQVQAPVSSVRG